MWKLATPGPHSRPLPPVSTLMASASPSWKRKSQVFRKRLPNCGSSSRCSESSSSRESPPGAGTRSQWRIADNAMKSEPKKRTPPKASKLETAVHSAPKDDLLIAAVGASAGGLGHGVCAGAAPGPETSQSADRIAFQENRDVRNRSDRWDESGARPRLRHPAQRDDVHFQSHAAIAAARGIAGSPHADRPFYARAGGRTWESRHRRDLVRYGDGRNAGNGGNSSARRSHLRAGWRFRET